MLCGGGGGSKIVVCQVRQRKLCETKLGLYEAHKSLAMSFLFGVTGGER